MYLTSAFLWFFSVLLFRRISKLSYAVSINARGSNSTQAALTPRCGARSKWVLSESPPSAPNRRQAPNGTSNVPQRDLGAPTLERRRKALLRRTSPSHCWGIHLVALCNCGDFGKEITGNRAIGFGQAWAYKCYPKPLVRGRCATRPDRSR